MSQEDASAVTPDVQVGGVGVGGIGVGGDSFLFLRRRGFVESCAIGAVWVPFCPSKPYQPRQEHTRE